MSAWECTITALWLLAAALQALAGNPWLAVLNAAVAGLYVSLAAGKETE